jgi:UDP-N-acetylglucosamine--N-acetylmuramyl-(pentapeptide) pyrophosphoryl-undecaprenol N-acetylglucosamine transferase
LSSILFPLKLIVAIIQSLALVMKFKPRVAIGSGAYVSGPLIWAASVMGAKIILLEQNSYPGITNRLLEKKADEVHISFEESKKYFRFQNKLKLSGNPTRIDLELSYKPDAIKKFGLDPQKKILLVIGGSLGARSINEAVAGSAQTLSEKGIQIIWQTGPLYFEEYRKFESKTIKVFAFIDDMSAAFSAADLVVTRSGATTIAEAANLALPVIFVPSTNVAANHQFKNAKAISDSGGALLIEDRNLKSELVDRVLETIYDNAKLADLKKNISAFSRPEAAIQIANSAIRLAEKI